MARAPVASGGTVARAPGRSASVVIPMRLPVPAGISDHPPTELVDASIAGDAMHQAMPTLLHPLTGIPLPTGAGASSSATSGSTIPPPYSSGDLGDDDDDGGGAPSSGTSLFDSSPAMDSGPASSPDVSAAPASSPDASAALAVTPVVALWHRPRVIVAVKIAVGVAIVGALVWWFFFREED
jgi:hypothetical protein